MATIEELRKKVKFIDAVRKKSDRQYNRITIDKQAKKIYYFHSILFKNSIYGNEANIAKGIFNTETYSYLPLSFFDFPFYVNIHFKDEIETKEIIDSINNQKLIDTPIVLVNPQKLIKDNNILYRFTAYVSLDIMYEAVIYNKIYFDISDNPMIKINTFDDDTFNKIKIIKEYLNKFYPTINVDFGFAVQNLKDLMELQKYGDILGSNIIIYLPETAFLDEEKNPSSFRKILYDKKMIKHLEFTKQMKIYYLKTAYNSFEEIIEFEKAIDVILARIPSNAIPLDKLVFISLILINYLNYDKEDGDIRNLYEVFKEKLGVCREFAEIFNTLMTRVGIKSECVYAPPIRENEDGHVFNVVTINEKNYYVDITYVMDEIKTKYISSISESPNFLTDNKLFDRYHKRDLLYKNYKCETMNVRRIEEAIEIAKKWNSNYNISLAALKDLFKKRKQKVINERELLDAMPRIRGGR